MLLIVDNYDSFVYNIINYINDPEIEFKCIRNDKINVDEIERDDIDGIIISPGPMSPKEAGVSNAIIKKFYKKLPILGICLGHQCIADVFNCNVKRYINAAHGIASNIILENSLLYNNLPNIIKAGRYHSLFVEKEHFNSNELRINASLEDGTIMGIEHKKYNVYGVQFHPESILTNENGKIILQNFINIYKSMRNV